MNGNEYILVDICGTLFQSNTTIDFLRYTLDNKKIEQEIKLIRSLPWRILNGICHRMFKYDLSRRMLLKHFNGWNKRDLNLAAEKFYTEYLLPRKNEEVWQIIEKADKKILLVSGTLDVIADCITNHIHATKTISSHLEYKDNICTGILKKDVFNNKFAELKKQEFIPPFHSIVTDNIGDSDIIKICKHKYIVVYDNLPQWNKLLKNQPNIHYIIIDPKEYYIR